MESKVAPLGARKLSSQMYAELERVIVDCSLPPGTVLNDTDLAAQFGVSRTPVRDTLHLLEASGLVERGRSTGWTVTPIRLDDVNELAELRALLEPAGLRKIVEWEDEALAKLATMFDDFAAPLGRDAVEAYLVRDDDFHRTIVRASQNSRLERAYHVVDRQLARSKRYVSYEHDGRRDQSLSEHRAICHALGRRDLDAATSALVDHLRFAHQALAAFIKDSLT
jgi:DNA-binding GntR family transcriptional regulator